MKGMFFDGEFQSSRRISHKSENFGFCCCVTSIIITLMFMFAMYGIELRCNKICCVGKHESVF